MTISTPATSSVPDARNRRTAAILVTTAAVVIAGIIAVLWPAYRTLAGYGLYAIPAHLLISVLANEPVLLASAKLYPPALVAIAGTAGCLVAIVLDYSLIGWLVNHRLVRREIEDSNAYVFAQRFFGRAPFLIVLLFAFLPLPFYPVKILAIARDYPVRRFGLALAIGRLPRFYLLAVVGQKVQAPNSALVSAGVALALMGGWGVWRTYRRNRARAQNGAN